MNIKDKIQKKLNNVKHNLKRAEKEFEECANHYKSWVQNANAYELITFSQSYISKMEAANSKIINLSEKQIELEYYLTENEDGGN